MSLCMIKTGFAICMCVSVLACSSAVEESKKPPKASSGGSSTGGNSPVATAGTGFGQSGSAPFSDGGTGFGQGGGGGAATAGTGTGTGGTGIVVAMCGKPQGAEAPLPLAITPNFIPSGYFAGPATNTTGIVEGVCEARPEAHTVGACFKYTFQAATLEGEGAYGGVFWQYGANNWGVAPGMKVAPGATKVTFKAWSASEAGGEIVQFSAGGIGSVTSTCADTVSLGLDGGTSVTLTTTPTEYTIDLGGQTYPNGVIGGFVWSTAVTSVDEVVSFYVDEIQWVE